MLTDFLEVARQSGVVEIRGETIIEKQLRMTPLMNFHNIRQGESRLGHPQRSRISARSHRTGCAGLPGDRCSCVRRRLLREFLRLDQQRFAADYAFHRVAGESKPMHIGAPFLLKGFGARTGVLLIHGYMAAPEEVRPLANYLHKHGLTVYACRLWGHGTSPEDLAGRCWEEWLLAVERGYLVLTNCCRDVVLGGFSAGAGLALLAGAGNLPKVRAIFGINPPAKLRRKAARLAPAVMLWNSLVERIAGEDGKQHFVPNEPENPDINYHRNPISGLNELLEMMERVAEGLKDCQLPALIIQGSDDPVVDPKGSELLYRGTGQRKTRSMPFSRRIGMSSSAARARSAFSPGFCHSLRAGSNVLRTLVEETEGRPRPS